MNLDWHTEYARALALFGGDTPSATLEQEILDAFTEHPKAVANAITKIGKAYAAGKIHSPWGALKAEIPKQVTSSRRVDSSHEDRTTTERAEQWIRNAGLHYDRWTEVEDELMRREKFAAIATPELLERMLALWVEVRPAGVQTELEELERADRWKESRARLAAPRQPTEEAAA